MESRFTKSIFLAVLSSIVVGCGGSSGGQQQRVLEGVFLDSAVMGLAYRTATRSGVTDSAGTFEYLAGETVTFSLGGVEFGSAAGGSQLTPFDLAGVGGFDDASPAQIRRITNILIFLQSLDADGNPDNGIDLGSLDTALVSESIDFDMDTTSFRGSRIAGLVEALDRRLVDESSAVDHFLDTLDATISVKRPIMTQYDIGADDVVEVEVVYEYDSIGLHTKTVSTGQDPFLVTQSSYEYDPQNKLVVQTDGEYVDGLGIDNQLFPRVTTYSYTEFGKLSTEEISAGTQARIDKQYFYDEFDRLNRLEVDWPAYRDPREPIFAAILDIEGIDFSGYRARAIGAGTIQAPPEASLGQYSYSSLDEVGRNLSSAGLIYSDLGHIDQVNYRSIFVSDGETEEVVLEEEVRQFDSSRRLVSALGRIYVGGESDEELLEIETTFSFLESGFMQSCSVLIDDEIAAEFVQVLDTIEIPADNYFYSGRCGSVFQTAEFFTVDGHPESAESSILSTSSIDISSSRIEHSYVDDELSLTSFYDSEGNLRSTIEYSADATVYTSYDGEGVAAFSSVTTFEEFEMTFKPNFPQIGLNLGGTFNPGIGALF